MEFKLGGEKCVRSEIEDDHQLVFTFVRGDGKRHRHNQRGLLNRRVNRNHTSIVIVVLIWYFIISL